MNVDKDSGVHRNRSRFRRITALVAVAVATAVAVPFSASLTHGSTSKATTATSVTEPQTVQTTTAATVTRKYVYLTFDDGPHPTYTPQVLAILQRYGVKATFFEIGGNVARYPSITRQLHLRGHSVQNHTWSHPDLRTVSYTRFRYEVLTTDRYIRAQTGYTPRCLRPPYGATNSLVKIRAEGLGKKLKLWTHDTRDWARPGSTVIATRALSNVTNGSIVLMHDGGGNRSQTVAALPTIIRNLKARGFTFATLRCA